MNLPTICLNMIVKNESKIIARLLGSVFNIIDSYCICDTGSTDDTVTKITDFFMSKNIPGKIIMEPFKNFEYNRNIAIQSAIGMSDFLLLMDADMILDLTYVKGFKNVWLLKDVPDEILDKLKMQRRDMGIDLIVETDEATYNAVQCKYKKHLSTKQNILSWKALSTFYALCLRTGPWDKYIVMTNCIYTRHQGKKTKQDVSYCLKTLQNINKEEWLRMCNVQGSKLGTNDELPFINEIPIVNEMPIINEIPIIVKIPSKKIIKNKVLTKEELRDLRSSYYSQHMN